MPAGRRSCASGSSKLSFFNGKEPFGHLTSFSALLKVPAARRSCASGSSAALTFQWQRGPKVLPYVSSGGSLIPFICKRSLRSSQFSMAKSPLLHPLCGLKCQLAAAHVPAEAPQLSFFQWQRALWSPNILFCAAQSARWPTFMCQRKLSFFNGKEPFGSLISFTTYLIVFFLHL